MTTTLEELEADLKKIELAKDGFVELANAGVTFDEARYWIVARNKTTIANASHTLELLEKATGRELRRN